MKKFYSFVCICMAIIILTNSGCATIFGHSSYKVTVNSNPPGSTITITDKKGMTIYDGVTPTTINLKSSSGYMSKGQYQIKFHLNGYTDKTITLDSKLNGWYFANILLGGLVGMLIVDPASGAMYKITDTNLLETLQPATVAQVSKMEIIDINSLPKSALKNLVKIN